MADATLKQIVDFFGIGLSQFRKEWDALTEADRDQIKAGIGDGSLTY